MVLLGAWMCALGLAGVPAASAWAAAPREVRVGPAPVLPAGSRTTGPLAAAKPLKLAVTLEPRDPAALQAYATAVATPGSSVYRRYLTVAQFAARFAPAAAHIELVESALRAQSLHPGPVSADGLSIAVSATAGRLEHAFSTSLRRLVEPGGRSAFANTQAPLLPASVAGYVQGVVGLDSLAAPEPMSLARPGPHAAVRAPVPDVVTGGPQPCATAAQAATQGGYTADQLASAYGFSSLYAQGDEGAGQTVALYELESNSSSDIAAYQSCYGTSASVAYVKVDGGATGSPKGSGEAALDIEDVIGLAPKASILVYQGPNTGAGAYDTYSAIISSDQAKVISASWGACESEVGAPLAEAESTLFQEAATQGQTVLAAAGDNGSEDCGTGGLAVDDPGSQPFVTSVGGTSLLSPGPPPSETVWRDLCQGQPCGGGGGISSLWPMPAYQSGASPTLGVIGPGSSRIPCGAPPGSYCREVPDVSADADPATGYLIYFGGNGSATDTSAWGPIGGTSVGAPLWAALVALTNASNACGAKPLGFLNPGLYAAAGAAYSSDFNDVTSGNNDITGAGGGLFSAGPGYDMASGLGTPRAALPAALCAGQITVTDPGNQTSIVGTRVSLQVAASNSRGAALTYSASSLPPGLSISASGLITGVPNVAGTWTPKVTASDAAGGTGSVSMTWTVDPNTVTLTNPGSQTSELGTRLALQISGSDSPGTPLTYSASSLPPGLSISASGLVSGVPSKVGTTTTTITATDSTGGSGSVTLSWSIVATATVSRVSLTGIRTGKPKLSFTIVAGSASPELAMIAVRLPSGLSFSRANRNLAKGITLADGTKFRAAVSHGTLTIKLRAAASRVQVMLSSSVLSVGKSLERQVDRGRVTRLPLTLAATDSAHRTTPFALSLGV